jgi:hypothetical protein
MKFPMRGLAIAAIFLLAVTTLSAQDTKRYIVRAGEIPSKVLPAEAVYVLPVFTQGTVYMRDGSRSRQKFNYNIVLDEMQFIGTAGDTLTIAEPAMIKNLVIDSLLFYYEKNYLQVTSQVDSFKIAIKQILVQTPYRTRGGYDAPSATSSITTYSSILSRGSRGLLAVKKDVQFEKERIYFVSDKFDVFYKADKKSFLTIFGTKNDAILIYMKEHEINYHNEADLQKLLAFCVSNK